MLYGPLGGPVPNEVLCGTQVFDLRRLDGHRGDLEIRFVEGSRLADQVDQVAVVDVVYLANDFQTTLVSHCVHRVAPLQWLEASLAADLVRFLMG